MKIVLIANGYPTKREPQWGCFERDQALALSEQGHQVSVLYVDKRFRTYWRRIGFSHIKEKKIEAYGIFIIPTRWISWLSKSKGSKIQYWVSTHLLDLIYRKYIREHGCPDIIYAHYLYNISYAVFLKKKYGVPIVGIEHWSVLNQKNLSQNLMFRGRIAYNHADKLLAVSESLKAQIKSHFGVDSTVVYDMLGQEFVSSSVNKRKNTHPFRYIAVGSLISRKGFDLLLRAFCKSELKKEGCCVVIIGGGSEKANLLELAKQLNISDNVNLVGRKTKDEIISAMLDSHVFVLSSRAETFGVVCIEALSQGLPNIATICGGPEEFINEQNGIMVPSENVEALSEAMVNIYNNYSKYDNEAIAEECKRRFAPQIIAKQLTEIFEEVVDSKKES